MRIVDKARNAFMLLKNQCSRTGKRKIDLYSSKYDLGFTYFLGLLLLYGIFLFQIIVKVTVAGILQSWQLFFDVLPHFSGALIVYAITMFLLAYFRKITLYTFFEEPRQRPQILWNQRIAKVVFRVFFASYYASMFAAVLLMSFENFPDFAKQWSVLAFSALVTFTSISFLFGFSMFLKLGNKEIVLYGLDYLSKIQGQDRKVLVNHMGFISREVLENLHRLFLSHWKFAQQINLWSQFNVILLGLIVGNKHERKATTTFLSKLYKMINDGDEPQTYRQIVETLDEFQTSMKSLCELRDMTMLNGRPTIRRPMLERIREYAPIATLVGTLIAILAFIIQVILRWV